MDAVNRAVRKRLDTLSQRESAVATALHALIAIAAEHGVPTDRAALGKLAQAVEGFRDQTEIWLDYREVLAELSTLRTRRSDLTKYLALARTKVTTLAERLGVLAERSKADARASDDATEARDSAGPPASGTSPPAASRRTAVSPTSTGSSGRSPRRRGCVPRWTPRAWSRPPD